MVKFVGILNITPDSFSDGGLYLNPRQAIIQARQLFTDGAALVDVGAESTRPNAEKLTDEQEWQRLEPAIKELLVRYPGKISLDSYHATTVRKTFEIGPVIVNDVTGLNQPDMLQAVIDLKSTVIISHLPGSDIQAAHMSASPIDDIQVVKDQLLSKAKHLINSGIEKQQIILDPGIGFGKTMELNRGLLTFAELVPDFDVMIGYSRKRFLGEHRMELEPNLEAGRVAIAHSAKYLRVHDVKGHAKFLR